MSENNIFSGKTLDEAITNAAECLLIPSEKLDYKVIQEATKGFFGIGAKPFMIDVSVKKDSSDFVVNDELKTDVKPSEKKHVTEFKSHEKTKQSNNENKKDKAPAGEKKNIKELKPSAEKNESRENRKHKNEHRNYQEIKNQTDRADKIDKSDKSVQPDTSDNSDKTEKHEKGLRPDRKERIKNRNQEKRNRENINTVQDKKEAAGKVQHPASERNVDRIFELSEDPDKRAEEFLTGLFASMDMKIDYSAKFDNESYVLNVNLSGEDMGALIGKRGQTLDALQYLTSQVVNKHQSGYIRVKLDTENYRERRKETMETLAQSIAQKVKKTRRPVALEPMNPYERRIIHSVLQSDKEVITRSEGEEPYRHVVVCPARKKK